MKKLGHIIANLTIKDYAMLLLSFIALMIMSAALCHKHDHDEHAHTKEMQDFWNETHSGQKTAGNQAFGEPMDKLVGAMTTPNQLEDDLSEEDLAQIERAAKNAESLNKTSEATVAPIGLMSQTDESEDLATIERVSEDVASWDQGIKEAVAFTSESEAALHNDAILEEELNPAVTAVATDEATSDDIVISDDLLMGAVQSGEPILEGVAEANENALNEALEAIAAEEVIDEALLEEFDGSDGIVASDEMNDELSIDDFLLADVEDEEPTPSRSLFSSFIGFLNGEKPGENDSEDDYVEYTYGDDLYDEDYAAEATADAAYYDEDQDIALRYKECGIDNEIETNEEWLKHLKGKIKELMLEDEDNECLDLLLNEFYIAS